MAATFWEDVACLLTKEYGHPSKVARQGVKDYRKEIMRRNVAEDVVYNQGEERTAKVVDVVIQKGLPKFVQAKAVAAGLSKGRKGGHAKPAGNGRQVAKKGRRS